MSRATNHTKLLRLLFPPRFSSFSDQTSFSAIVPTTSYCESEGNLWCRMVSAHLDPLSVLVWCRRRRRRLTDLRWCSYGVGASWVSYGARMDPPLHFTKTLQHHEVPLVEDDDDEDDDVEGQINSFSHKLVLFRASPMYTLKKTPKTSNLVGPLTPNKNSTPTLL